jgi:hypothetical protein
MDAPNLPSLLLTSDHALTPDEPRVVEIIPGASNVAVTLPDARSVVGRTYTIKLYRSAAGIGVVNAVGKEQCDRGAVGFPINLASDGICVRLFSDGSGWIMLSALTPPTQF